MSKYAQRDRQIIWHPYTQMLNAKEAIAITHGRASLLFDEDGKSYIDAVSSWWTNLHGHSHPYMIKQLSDQLETLDHVIFAGFTHPWAIELAEKISKLLPGKQSKAFYSDNGSTAVEVAVKLSLQYWKNKGKVKNRILAFQNAYHGDTFGSMSVSGRGAFNKAFQDHLFEVDFLPIPSRGKEEESLNHLRLLLEKYKDQYASFIYEPLIQGAAGMRIFDAGALDCLLDICRSENIICIADEVMTGFGRTGPLFASNECKIHPDIYCLSKGITGGLMPLGLTTCTEDIYEAFLGTENSKTFYHGHSYTANPLACRAGLASLDLLLDPDCGERRMEINKKHQEFIQSSAIANDIDNIRVRGTILAFEVKSHEDSGYFNNSRDSIFSFFTQRGILIRPLGNTIYLMPPYCITGEELDHIYDSLLIYCEQKNSAIKQS